jgi:restriction endonuclease S subunit
VLWRAATTGKIIFFALPREPLASHINKTQLGNFPVMLPPLALQRIFAERVADIQATVDQMDRAAAAAEQLQATLMARLFGGE